MTGTSAVVPSRAAASKRAVRDGCAVLAALLLFVWLAAGFVFLVFPDEDEPREVDAVFVLGPAWPQRIDTGVQLVEAGYADTLIVSAPSEGGRSIENLEICTTPQEFTVHCLAPEPDTTQGEARGLAALVDEHGWDSVLIVTMRPHMTRAELYFERCFDGEILMVDDERPLPAWFWARQFLYETVAFVKYALIPSC